MPGQHHHGAAKKKRARRIRNAFFFSLSNDSPAELHFQRHYDQVVMDARVAM